LGFFNEYGKMILDIKHPWLLPPEDSMYNVILEHQRKWAIDVRHLRKDEDFFILEHGQCYTFETDNNFFIPLSEESINEFKKSPGNELKEDKWSGKPKMNALHSSSALVINIFEHWKKIKKYTEIAVSLGIDSNGIKSMHYESIDENLECKFKTFFNTEPHPDVYFEYNDGSVVSIECKYTEPFNKQSNLEENKKNSDFKELYVIKGKGSEFEKRLPKLFSYSQKLFDINEICSYKYLDVKQLIKHILGMEATIENRSKYKLLYLYYPSLDICFPSIKEINDEYKKEILRFTNELDEGIQFYSLTWYDLLRNLYCNQSTMSDSDKQYLYYNISRY
jgi:histidinol phosphatase-like PHP family hydrolase